MGSVLAHTLLAGLEPFLELFPCCNIWVCLTSNALQGPCLCTACTFYHPNVGGSGSKGWLGLLGWRQLVARGLSGQLLLAPKLAPGGGLFPDWCQRNFPK